MRWLKQCKVTLESTLFCSRRKPVANWHHAQPQVALSLNLWHKRHKINFMNWLRKRGVIIWIALGAIGYITVELMIANDERITNYSLCNDEEAVRMEYWGGVVSRKFLDSENHNYKTLEIKERANNRSRTFRLILSNDKSGLYPYVSEGDSIVKQSGSLAAKVIHDTVEREFIIDLGCAE